MSASAILGGRIPKPLLTQAGLGDAVELRMEAGAIRIESVSAPRAGWTESAEQLVMAEGTDLLDALTLTRLDRHEWEA